MKTKTKVTSFYPSLFMFPIETVEGGTHMAVFRDKLFVEKVNFIQPGTSSGLSISNSAYNIRFGRQCFLPLPLKSFISSIRQHCLMLLHDHTMSIKLNSI